MALNDGSMASDKVIDVKDTAFDFIEFNKIGDVLKRGHDNLSKNGIDHNYVFEVEDFKLMAELKYADLKLSVESDLPDMHIYTANYLGDIKGKNGLEYHDYYGICFECQFYPNAMHYDKYIKPYIYANKIVKHCITYTLNER